MRAVENGHAERLLFEIAPVRIGLGDVPAQDKMVCGFAGDKWEMCGERAVIGCGNENGEGVGAHECERIGVITDEEVFGDVHESLSPLRGSFQICARTHGSRRGLHSFAAPRLRPRRLWRL
jgi:hypothetical protein